MQLQETGVSRCRKVAKARAFVQSEFSPALDPRHPDQIPLRDGRGIRHCPPMTVPELRDELVIVTGGANGIGAAIVEAFHRQGAIICFCDIDSRNGRRLQQTLRPRARFHPVNLASEQQIQSWMKTIAEMQKPVRALINNAARDPRIELSKTTATAWDELHALNLRACFLMSREAVPLMTSGSAIINLASITFHQGPAPMSAYVATKGGIIGFTRALARELGSRRIRVNTLSPGWVMTKRQLKEHIQPATRKLIRRAQCIPDLIQPREIADVAIFLASDASRAITGQEILVDRGWHHS